jgi:hypothetical protein
MALIFTSPSAIFLWADVKIREKVGLDILINFAASICLSSSRQARRTASNSSRVKDTTLHFPKGRHNGLKHLSPGTHLTHRVFLGLTAISYYEHMFEIILSQKNTASNTFLAPVNKPFSRGLPPSISPNGCPRVRFRHPAHPGPQKYKNRQDFRSAFFAYEGQSFFRKKTPQDKIKPAIAGGFNLVAGVRFLMRA